jgi:hypothetical protein
VRVAPITFFLRESLPGLLACAGEAAPPPSGAACRLLTVLADRGPSFFHDWVRAARLLPSQAEQATANIAVQLVEDFVARVIKRAEALAG